MNTQSLFTDRPLRMSMIYYFGLEGLGSLDWESDQNDDVRVSYSLKINPNSTSAPRVLKGRSTCQVQLQISETSRFALRTVRDNSFHCQCISNARITGLGSRYTTRGGHAEDFTPRLGKIHYFGTAMPAGDVWKAKDYLYQHIGRRAQQVWLRLSSIGQS
jgi:mannosyl-oligosaccharide glucosidase